MQLLIAVVQADDADRLCKQLAAQDFHVTHSTPWVGSSPRAM